MSDFVIWGVPFLCLAFLGVFAGILIPWQAHSTVDRGTDTKDHSERIYKDFDMYLKIVLGLITAFGYIRFEKYDKATQLSKQALQIIGAISLLVMLAFSIFVICHQGSKVRRWKHIEWPKAIFWQELWAVFFMWLFASGIWLAAFKW